MRKDFVEKREITINVWRTVCDVCGDTLKDGGIRFRLAVEREVGDDSSFYAPKVLRDHPTPVLDFCSVECLQKPATQLLLQSKIIPSVPDLTASISYREKSSDSLANEVATYKSAGGISR